MPSAETLYRLGRGISEGIITRKEREEKKKLDWTDLLAEIKGAEADREQTGREWRQEYRFEERKWTAEHQLALEKAAREADLNQADIERLKALTQKYLAEAEKAKRMPVGRGKEILPSERRAREAKAALESKAYEIYMQGLDTESPFAPPPKWQMDLARQALDIEGPDIPAEVGEKDVYNAYQSLMRLTDMFGNPAYSQEEAWRIANQGRGTQQETKPGAGAIPAGRPAMVPSAAPESTQIEKTVQMQKPPRVPTGLGLPVEGKQPAVETDSIEVRDEDSAASIAQKILAAVGTELSSEQLRVLEQNLHSEMPGMAAQIMQIIRQEVK